MTKQNQNQELCTTLQLHSPPEHLPTSPFLLISNYWKQGHCSTRTATKSQNHSPLHPQQASWSLSPSHAILRVPHHCPTLSHNALTLGTFSRGLLLKQPSCFIALASLFPFQRRSERLSSHTDFIKPLLLMNPSVDSRNSSQNRPSQESYGS